MRLPEDNAPVVGFRPNAARYGLLPLDSRTLVCAGTKSVNLGRQIGLLPGLIVISFPPAALRQDTAGPLHGLPPRRIRGRSSGIWMPTTYTCVRLWSAKSVYRLSV